MKVLAIDTATDSLGVALLNHETGVHEIFTKNAFRKQSSMLHRVIDDILVSAGITAQDISLVISTKGPGSFTGVRIGLAAAQGIAKGLGIPLVGVSTLEVMSNENGASTVWLGAIRGEVYMQSFDDNSVAVNEPVVLPIEESARKLKIGQVLCICGDISLPKNMPKVNIKNVTIDPLRLAKLGLEIYKNEGEKDVKPLYLSQLKYRKLSDNK